MPQMEAVECGAACLAMVLRSFGHHAELSELREACGVSRAGVNARTIVRVARAHGLEPRARRVEPAALAELERPAILHWEMNHFVVLRRWTPRAAYVLDPAVGPRKVAPADFDRSFTGICIELAPTAELQPRRRHRASLTRVRRLLAGSRTPLGLVLAASFAINVLAIAVPLATQMVIDQVLAARRFGWLEVIAGSALALVLLRFGLSLLRDFLVNRLGRFLDATIAGELVGHLFRLPYLFFTQRYAADLLDRVQSTRTVRDILTGQAVALLVDGAMLAVYLALMLLYELRLGLVVAAAGAAYVVVFLLARVTQLARLRERLIKEVKHEVQLVQTIQGVVTIKAAGRESEAHQAWLTRLIHALSARVDEERLQRVVAVVRLVLTAGTPVLVLVWGGYLVLAGELSLGTLVGFQMLQLGFLLPLDQVIDTLLRMQELPVHLERMDDVLRAPVEPSGSRPCPPLKGAIVFDEVTFAYGANEAPVLDGVSFQLTAGQKVALVGPSGSGKSTVARLLMGLVRPRAGRISVDGNELAELDLASYRQQLGVVLQEPVIFSGTVRENISLYYPAAPLEDVVAAATVAQIHDDIKALPLGYDTHLSPGRGPLSGGQLQRLALARAVVHRPAILILDEATSAVDTATEAAVERYLATRSCTRIVIAHRLSTVRDADLILLLDGGAVREAGTHAELLARGGRYAQLVAERARRAGAGDDSGEPARPAGDAELDLGRFAALTDISGEDRAIVAGSCERRVYGAGQLVAEQGLTTPGLLLVAEGELTAQVHEPGLSPWTAARAGAGDTLEEAGLLDGAPAAATISAGEAGATIYRLPRHRFEDLSRKGDRVAAALTVALGRVVCARLRESADRRQALAHERRKQHHDAERDEDMAQRAASWPTEIELRQTTLGAACSTAELERLQSMGEHLRLRGGEKLFAQDERADAFYVVLGGRIGVGRQGLDEYLSVAKPGQLLGEVGFFDRGARAADCVAIAPSALFRVRYERVAELLAAADPVGDKILRHLAHTVIDHFRRSQLRLRDAAADVRGESAQLHRRREKAHAQLSRARQANLIAAALAPRKRARMPVVEVSDAARSAAAGMAAVLYHHGRPVPLLTVAEACTAGGAITPSSLIAGGRSLGLSVRQLTLDAGELRFLSDPLLLSLDGGAHYVLAHRWRGAAGVEVMDPVAGEHRLVKPPELRARFAGTCFEVRCDATVAETRSLRQRAWQVVRAQRAVGLQITVAALMLQLAVLALPAATALFIGTVLPAGEQRLLWVLGGVLLAIVASQTVLAELRLRAITFLRARLDYELLDQLLRHVLRLPLAYFERRDAGAILQRFQAFQVLRNLLTNNGLSALFDLATVVLALLFLVATGGRLIVVVIVATLLAVVAVGAALPRLRRQAAISVQAGAEQTSRLLEAIGGIVTSRLTGRASAGVRRWSPAFLAELSASAGQQLLASTVTSVIELIRLAALIVTLWWGASAVIAGSSSLALLVAFAAVLSSYLMALSQVAGQLLALGRVGTHADLLRETFAAPPEQRGLTAPPGKLRGQVTLDDVSFAYEPDASPVLRHVSLDIRAGAKVALVGRSGSGKTTLAKLLLGFYAPTSGRVLFDGRDLDGIDLSALRAQVGVVMQQTHLFSGSVRSNLTINQPDAALDAVVAAARQALIHDDIEQLPMQYETIIAEGGANFSGGQRQRLALARALIHDPAILLLDEATSALDNRCQALVEEHLRDLPCTRVVIAHRLSTIEDADLIAVLDHGSVVESGTHQELLARGGAYAALVGAQLHRDATTSAQPG